jgi:hypothetical protein
VRIDHRAGVMRLGNDIVEAALVRRQLAELSSRLQLLVENVYPLENVGASVPKERRATIFTTAARLAETTRRTLEARKSDIQRSKEENLRVIRQQQIMVRGRARPGPPTPPTPPLRLRRRKLQLWIALSNARSLPLGP